MLPDSLTMLRRLVATPSVSSIAPELDQSCLPILDLLANWLDESGFRVEIHHLPEAPEKASLVARIGSGTGGVAFAGHVDTVPFDESTWRHDPFDMQIDDGIVSGLGVCDMKGFFPMVLGAVAEFGADRLKRPVTVVATCDEESTMAGARFLAGSQERLADAVVIGEPTDLRPVIAHKGFMVLSISAKGTGGHSSNPFLGKNALEAIHEVMSDLIEYRRNLISERRDQRFDVPSTTLNFGCLHAGDSPNRICENARLDIDVRMLPRHRSPGEVLQAVSERADDVSARLGMDVSVEVSSLPVDPFEGTSDCLLSRTLASATGNPLGAAGFATEAPLYLRMGMEVAVCGPGSIDQAHRPNESLDWRREKPARKILLELIRCYCVAL